MLGGPQEISGLAAGAEGHQHVSRPAQSLDLAFKDLIITVIVPNGRNDRSIRGQRNGCIWPPLALIAPHQFRGEVLRLRRAAAIARQQHRMVSAQGRYQGRRDVGNDAGLHLEVVKIAIQIRPVLRDRRLDPFLVCITVRHSRLLCRSSAADPHIMPIPSGPAARNWMPRPLAGPC